MRGAAAPPATAPPTTAPATRPAASSATQPAGTRRVHVFVAGHVQGVGFRAFTAGNAQRLGLTGYVLNLRDGRVEAVIEGPGDAVVQLLDLLRRGPASARVDKLDVTDEPPRGQFTTFRIDDAP